MYRSELLDVMLRTTRLQHMGGVLLGLILLVGCARASTSFTRSLELGGHHLTLVGRDIYSGRFTNSRIARQEIELLCTSSKRRLLHQPYTDLQRPPLQAGEVV